MKDARRILQRLEALGKITDEPGKITRVFASPAMRRANDLVAGWMRAAGMQTRLDAMGNLIGHYDGGRPNAKILLLGSHLDTVRHAGKFDGPLGVMLAIACVEKLRQQKIRLPFAVEVAGFADEEGVRYHTTYLGSRVLAGCFDAKELRRQDADGITMAEALKRFGGDPSQLKTARLNPGQLLGYLEAHIEQGPVLEDRNLALGVVSAIAGQTRARLSFLGRAGHAGTTPMQRRQDALCAAAEFILAAEALAKRTAGLVATVGEISAAPGAGNVIPGAARLSLDVRHATDVARQSAQAALKKAATRIARRRKLRLQYAVVHETASVNCSEKLTELLGDAIKRRQKKVVRLVSGAGHDAAVMAGVTPSAMLFIRCREGISHHPDESAKTADVQLALAVMTDFLLALAKKCGQSPDLSDKHFI
jgi:allantoate deiminase